jgi:FkbM family methyltransferase
MLFYDENGFTINHERIEKREQDLANEYILPDDVVLELGARYGTVSCIINNKLNNKNNQVVVEPDERVWDALEKNKSINNCEFNIIKGFISNKKLNLINKNVCLNGYGSTYILDNDTNIKSYTMEEINILYNLKFTALVADCEGFLEVFLDENPEFYNNLRILIFEKDYPCKCDYNKIINNLKEHNFVEIYGKLDQTVWKKIN